MTGRDEGGERDDDRRGGVPNTSPVVTAEFVSGAVDGGPRRREDGAGADPGAGTGTGAGAEGTLPGSGLDEQGVGATGGGESDDVGRVPWHDGDVVAHRYQVERRLGGGSMGDVFLAEDRLLRKPIAIKVLRADLAKNRDTVRRFLREVALAHSVTHKNVVRIYDTGEEGGLPFFTMEYLQGQVLDELLEDPRGRPLPPGDRLPLDKIREIVFDVLDAMETAHRAGVVHRDLKPGNVMLTHRGAIVMDFGVAGIDDVRDLGRAQPSTDGLTSLVRTEVGTIFGSPAYMAPELWEGQPATVQSDLYAFGVMLYQMLTGRLPFFAKTPAAFVEQLSTAPPPPLRSLRRDVPWNLVRLVRRCMARSPEDRPTSATAAANLISPLRNRQRRRLVVGAAGLAAALLGALALRAQPSWRDLGLPDSVAEEELSAAVRSFDVGEDAAALRRLTRLSGQTPDAAALVFWRATLHHDLGDEAGRLASCRTESLRGSSAWVELAEAACESTYRLAEPASSTLEDGPLAMGPEMLPLAVTQTLLPRLEADPNDDDAARVAQEVLERMREEPDWEPRWALPVRWKLARLALGAALGDRDDPRDDLATWLEAEPTIPLVIARAGTQALLDGDTTRAEALAQRVSGVDPTLARRLEMHDGRLELAWSEILRLGDHPRGPALRMMWCGYALRFEVPTTPSRCQDLPPGLARALWDVHEGRPADVGRLGPAAAAVVERYADVQAGRCGEAAQRPPRLSPLPAPFELLPSLLELTAALCPASPASTDLERARTLATALSSLAPQDPWVMLAHSRVDEAEGHPKLAASKRMAASERWAEADATLPLPSRLRTSLGPPRLEAPAVPETVAGGRRP